MEDTPSARLIDQRLRNRLMEAVLKLAEGDDGVRKMGAVEFFNYFFDFVSDVEIQRNSALSVDERDQLTDLYRIVNTACDDTPTMIKTDELIRTGWPDRIAPEARRVLETFLIRGRFDENREEAEPSSPKPWP
jgi:hypothetical protein